MVVTVWKKSNSWDRENKNQQNFHGDEKRRQHGDEKLNTHFDVISKYHLSLSCKKHGLKYICDLFETKHTECFLFLYIWCAVYYS